jgi:hypothetical protein
MLLEGTEEQMTNGLKILKPLLKKEESYSPDSPIVLVIENIKYLCRNFEGKNRDCLELGISY